MNKQKNAKLMLSISMIIFGTIGAFTRAIDVSSGELALYRAVMAVILLLGFFTVTRQKIELRAIKKELWLLLLSGMAMGVNWILLFEAYKYTTISAATLSYYFAPVIVTVACPLLFKEKITPKQILCFVLSTIGLVLVILFEEKLNLDALNTLVGSGLADGAMASAATDPLASSLALPTGREHLIGVLFGLGAAVFYATVILLNKCIKQVAGIQRTFLQFVAAIMILVPYVACSGGVQLGGLNGKGWICLVIVGVIHTGITYCMYFTSLKELKGQEISILSYLDPLVAVLVSVVVLGEQMTWLQVLGGVLILGCTLWNELGQQT